MLARVLGGSVLDFTRLMLFSTQVEVGDEVVVDLGLGSEALQTKMI